MPESSLDTLRALMLWGAHRPGCRPSTKLAWLTSAITDNNKIVGNNGSILKADGQPRATLRRFEPHEVVRTWHEEPNADQLKQAKKNLPLRLVR